MIPEEELFHPDPELMLVLLNSENVLERMQAARAFCEIQDPRAIPKLILLLEDTCTLVRVSVAYALGRNIDLSFEFIPESPLASQCPRICIVEYLISKLNNEWNGYVRKGIVWTLGNYRDPKALNPLISALKYDISAVRLWAASALGQLGQPEAIASLTHALEGDRMAGVRSNCAWALGKLLMKSDRSTGNDIYQEAVDALINALDDLDLGVQSDAKVTLRKLGDPRGLKVLEKIDYEQGYCDYTP